MAERFSGLLGEIAIGTAECMPFTHYPASHLLLQSPVRLSFVIFTSFFTSSFIHPLIPGPTYSLTDPFIHLTSKHGAVSLCSQGD